MPNLFVMKFLLLLAFYCNGMCSFCILLQSPHVNDRLSGLHFSVGHCFILLVLWLINKLFVL
jgi:hypothetical protein